MPPLFHSGHRSWIGRKVSSVPFGARSRARDLIVSFEPCFASLRNTEQGDNSEEVGLELVVVTAPVFVFRFLSRDELSTMASLL